jgi:hypothetical protein
VPIKFKQCLLPPEGCGQSKLTDEFWRDPKEPDGRQKRCSACVKERRRQRQEARAAGEEVPAFSEERRAELAARARDLHAEGRFGGSQFGKLGGRPRKARLADAVLEHFQDENKLKLVVAAYESALRSKDKRLRLKAATALNDLEQVEDRRQREARGSGKDPINMSPEELEEFLVQGLAGMIERGEIPTAVDALTLPDSAVKVIA